MINQGNKDSKNDLMRRSKATKKRDKIYNKGDTVLITWNGVTLTVQDWSRRLNINSRTMYTRLNRGWSKIKAISTPVRGYKGKI